MIDLRDISGLPIFLDEKKMDLEFRGDFPFIKKSERSLEELRPYLKNPEAAGGPDPVYRVWRHACLKQDEEKVKAANLRYDLTLIPPGRIDGEFAKTAGHYHKSYPEVYEVLHGRAYFLIQKPGKDFKNIESAILVEAGPGEKFLIPPAYGHNTINVFDEPLIMANWLSNSADPYDYEPYKILNGASYRLIAEGDLVDIVKNPAYESAPDIRKIRPKEMPQFGLIKKQPLYSLVGNLEKLRILNRPEEFSSAFKL